MTCDNCKPAPLTPRQEAKRLLRLGEQYLREGFYGGDPAAARVARCQMADAYASLAIGWAQVADDE